MWGELVVVRTLERPIVAIRTAADALRRANGSGGWPAAHVFAERPMARLYLDHPLTMASYRINPRNRQSLECHSGTSQWLTSFTLVAALSAISFATWQTAMGSDANRPAVHRSVDLSKIRGLLAQVSPAGGRWRPELCQRPAVTLCRLAGQFDGSLAQP
jgi:hypothetical protein